MTTEIKTYSDLANRILDKATDYFNEKQIIKKIFSINNEDHQETIRLRLTIIDSYYSTNMNRRYYGIKNLSSMIYYYYKDDLSLKLDLLAFITDPYNDQILDIFNSVYGINKKGLPKGRAMSLFSKYGYFLTNFQYPIYDSIVFETYPKIIKKYPEWGLNEKLPSDISGFMITMNNLNKSTQVNDFNKLDNLLWLLGKILKGNFSLILEEPTYKKIVDPIEINSKTKSYGIDNIIKQHIFKNIDKLKHLISNDLFTMINFAIEINNNLEK